jgi:hypothetical protein
MWKGSLVRISLAAPGVAVDGGEAWDVGDPEGVAALLGVEVSEGVEEGFVDGEVVASWLFGASVQAVNSKASPASRAAGLTPLLPLP